MPTTGPQLRRLRRKANISVVAVAARMDCARQTVHTYELMAEVPPDKAEAYRRAVRDIHDATVAANDVESVA